MKFQLTRRAIATSIFNFLKNRDRFILFENLDRYTVIAYMLNSSFLNQLSPKTQERVLQVHINKIKCT